MSELINNREYRQKVLKEIISELHNGKSVEEVKPRFEELIQGVSVIEITEMEQALIKGGMPIEQIQNLCDVHASVFKGSIEEIHRPQKPEEIPGHPIHTFKLENRALERLISDKIELHIADYKAGSPKAKGVLLEDVEVLLEIDEHYLRKENLLFPLLEKYGITAPPKVMWGVDDEIRDKLKAVKSLLSQEESDSVEVIKKLSDAINQINEMIFKEENILFPMALETLSEDEWLSIADSSNEIGYSFINPVSDWEPEKVDIKEEETPKASDDSYVRFDAGLMTPQEINAILNTLPLDITFVDKNDTVKYFTQGKERIFARPKTIIGRLVQNCHPPASAHVVEKIVDDFKTGKKDHEDFWLKKGSQYVYIRYFAVRDNNGEYLGTIEVSQDIKPIQDITGEKRLMSE